MDLIRLACIAAGEALPITPDMLKRLLPSAQLVATMADGKKPVYGINTGFGSLAEVRIEGHDLQALQRNLVLSHAVGVGDPLSRRETRALMALRLQNILLGYSGVRPETALHLGHMLNRGVHPVVPEKGSVGASGDLAPLAHIACGMIGEGPAEFRGAIMPAKEALRAAELDPIILEAKEGLALVNGTQGMTSVGGLALHDALALAIHADEGAALTMEALGAKAEAFDPRIQQLRPHPGQAEVATHILQLCEDSKLFNTLNTGRVQDPYSIRCVPQVHGATRDGLAYAKEVLEREMNSVTDNPLVFPEDGSILSGGNFHGQPVAQALDFAAIALAELGNIAERRIEQLLNPALSGLPACLTHHNGLHSGYMMVQITAASLVNENKMLATPSSVDSIPGNAAREDHVSMGMTGARKLRTMVQNTRFILACEWLLAAQAVDLRRERPLGRGTQVIYDRIRQRVPKLDNDRRHSEDIAAIAEML